MSAIPVKHKLEESAAARRDEEAEIEWATVQVTRQQGGYQMRFRDRRTNLPSPANISGTKAVGAFHFTYVTVPTCRQLSNKGA